MESRHWNAAGGAPAARPEDPPYAGTAGQTRVEVAQLMLPSGQAVSVQVHRVVNVATDPHLGTPALAGILHRYDVGFELGLAVDFVYHDPAKRRFALVVPDALRHEELRLRAKLLEQIAEDAANPAPGYVREATTVVGVQALREYLERGDGRTALAAAEADLARRERELGGREGKLRDRETALKVREERLVKRAEGVTSREDELASRADEIEASVRDLGVRERELTTRLEALQEAEQRLAARERDAAARPAMIEPARNMLDAIARAGATAEPVAGHPQASPSPVLFGGPLPPLGTSIGAPPSQPPVASIPGAASSSAAGTTTPVIAPAAPRIDTMETRRVVLNSAGQLVGGSGLIPSLGSTPTPSPAFVAPQAAPHHSSPTPASPVVAPVPLGAGPIPSLAHPLAHPLAQHAAHAPPARATDGPPVVHVAPASAIAPAAGAPSASSTVVASPAQPAPQKPPSVPPPPPAGPVQARPAGSPPSDENAITGDDEDVVDASDLVVESTGFVRLEEVEELAEEEDVEELDVIDEVTGVTGVGRAPARPEPGEVAKVRTGARGAKRDVRDPITVEDSVDEGKTSVVAPPKHRAASIVVPGAWWRSGSQAFVHVADGSVRYFFRAGAEEAKSVEDGCEVRCQLAVVDGAPVVLLTLVVGRAAEARALARAVLDTGREEERRVLDTLRRAYRLQIVPVDGLGHATNVVDVASPREVNVARLVERLGRFSGDREHGGSGSISLRTVDKALSSPPPLHDPDEPFSSS
ncbi:MAG: hypothetical protein IT379_16110, partial [Deltaproteobacteria bacterium]|nr:hypothetical protein [Deltaproteobacteria bacterium]